MRVVFLSDIHSNLHALEAVLDGLKGESFDKLVVLGDTLGYNGNPQECLRLVREHADIVLLGNHDAAVLDRDLAADFNELAQAGVEASAAALDTEDLRYLRSLHPRADLPLGEVALTAVHASVRDPLHEYVFPSGAPDMLDWLQKEFPDGAPRLVAQGHTHVPMFFTPHTRRETPLYLLNPGSVGQPRDADPRAAWALFDTEARTPQFFRTPYDVQGAAKAIEQAGLPRDLGRRLFLGR